jgi:hypothetical protein
MKNFLFLSLLLISFASCTKKDSCSKKEEMTVITDCTGTYLRVDGKDYQVCNTEKMTGFENLQVVMADFKKIDECKGSAADDIVCMMLHENEGWIEVTSIAKK